MSGYTCTYVSGWTGDVQTSYSSTFLSTNTHKSCPSMHHLLTYVTHYTLSFTLLLFQCVHVPFWRRRLSREPSWHCNNTAMFNCNSNMVSFTSTYRIGANIKLHITTHLTTYEIAIYTTKPLLHSKGCYKGNTTYKKTKQPAWSSHSKPHHLHSRWCSYQLNYEAHHTCNIGKAQPDKPGDLWYTLVITTVR